MDAQEIFVVLPEWYNNLVIGALALSPLVVVVVQVLKVIGAQLGLPDGWGGYITLAVSTAGVALALYAGVFDAEVMIAEKLEIVQRFAETLLVFLGAIGWYRVGKKNRDYAEYQLEQRIA